MEEIWKDIIGYDGIYQISNYGRVRSFSRMKKGELVSPNPEKTRRGYLRVNLHKDNSVKRYSVHRLVAEAFIPNHDKSKNVINHIDFDVSNNHVENLEWVTQRENVQHAMKNGRIGGNKFGSLNHHARKVIQYEKDGTFVKEWDCIADASRFYKTYHSNISSCCSGKTKTSNGFIWRWA